VAAPVALVIALAAVDAVASSLLRPLRGSLVPMIARSPGELVASNVVMSTGTSAAGLVGPALAAILIATVGVESTFGLSAAVLVLALTVSLGIEASASLPSPRAGGAARGANGLRVLAQLRHARLTVGLIVAQRFVRGMLSVLIVALAVDLLRAGDEAVGILNSAIGLGGLAGGMLSFLLVRRASLAGPFLGALALWGAALAAPALVPALVPAAAVLAVGGIGKAVLEVAGVSLLQRTVPTAARPAVLGILESLVTAALAAGAVVGALLVEGLGPSAALIVAGLLPVIVALFAWPVMRGADDASVVPEKELRLLRGVSMFRPLSLTTHEELAGVIEHLAIPEGEIVIRQGDIGDRFYIVESGRLETLIDGLPIRVLGPGDSFGEIALIRDVPRTATVRALEPVVLAALARDPFLAAVTGRSEAAALAEDVIRGRLAG
jgi:predicted MFS family arabinose efflux permease